MLHANIISSFMIGAVGCFVKDNTKIDFLNNKQL